MTKTILAHRRLPLFAPTSIPRPPTRASSSVMDNPRQRPTSRAILPTGVTAVQPGVGADLDRYQGVADGNADLFNVMLDGQSSSHETPQIYSGAQGNPDLAF